MAQQETHSKKQEVVILSLMSHYGLIGKSLKHSFSKDYFINKFEKEVVFADYSLCELDMINNVENIFARKWNGLNVTIPYKEQIIPYLDQIYLWHPLTLSFHN